MDALDYPKDLRIFVTLKCNRECAHCYVESGPAVDGQAVDAAAALDFIRWLKERGLQRVVLDGGEPMLAPDAVQSLVRGCCECSMPVVVRTNGDHLEDSDALQEIRQYSRASLEISVGAYHQNVSRVSQILENLADLAKRTTLIRYDGFGRGTWAKAEADMIRGRVKLDGAFVCRFGRGKDLPMRYESLSLATLPACTAVGSSVTLYPDGTLWSCNGYVVHELWKRKLLESPLCWGNLYRDGAEACVERGRRRLPLRIIRATGPYGMVTALSLNSSTVDAQPERPASILAGDHASASVPESENEVTFDHICAACRWTFCGIDVPTGLQSLDADGKIGERLAEAWQTRVLLHPAP
jgi:hypothetical protein